MDHCNRIEDSYYCSYVDLEAQLRRFQRGMIVATGLKSFCDIFAKNMATFYTCPKNVPEATLKDISNGLISLSEISRYLILTLSHGY